MNVLVTGGAGFIGSHLVNKLASLAGEIVVYDNLTTGYLDNVRTLLPEIKFIPGDIRDKERLFSAMAGIDVVFHLAAKASVIESIQDPWTTHAVNNTGTLNILLGALHNDVKRVILASSCAVYGDAHQPPLNESYLPFPKSLYAATKVNLEAMAESFYQSHQLEYVALRFFNVYGHRQRADSEYAGVISKFINCYQTKQSPIIYGDGLQTRDFIYVEDVVQGLIRASQLDGAVLKSHRVFNLGTGNPVSIVELLKIISDDAGYELEPIYQPERAGEIRHSHADTRLAFTYQLLDTLTEISEGIKIIWDKTMNLK
ncbi:MAG: NAD-dependent epimerase/dehydratase family protein [Gloeomargarita sp. HHBFW_bins_162]